MALVCDYTPHFLTRDQNLRNMSPVRFDINNIMKLIDTLG